MKKLLALAGAAALAAGVSAPAAAQDVRGSVTITVGDHNNRYYRPGDRNDRFYNWRYFQNRARPYYYGYGCYRNEVLVVNPYNGRYYCMDARDYYRYKSDRRHSGRNWRY